MKITVWSVTFNDDDGVETRVFATEQAADDAFSDWVSDTWKKMWPLREKQKPEKAQDAYQILCDTVGFMDSIHTEQHEVEIDLGPLVVIIEGGALQSIVSNDKRLHDVPAFLIDYDTDGDEDVVKVPQHLGGLPWHDSSGRAIEEDAHVSQQSIDKADGIGLDETLKRHRERISEPV